jgi:peroxiredoxin
LCNQQVADFQAAWPRFQAENIGLIAASVDTERKANKMVKKNKVSFPFGYGLDAEAVSRTTGAFYEPEKKFLQAAGFLLRPGGAVEIASYSTANLGRFLAEHVLIMVKLLRKKK